MNDELNLCRVCLQVEGSEKFVQFHIKLRRIALKISGVQILQWKDLPALICHQCVIDVNAAEQIRRKLIKADEYYQTIHQNKALDVTDLSLKQEHEVDVTSYEFMEPCVHATISTDPNRTTKQTVKKLRFKKRPNEDKKFFCSKCFKPFCDARYLWKHEYFKHTEIPLEDLFVCDCCGHRTKSKQLVRNHITTMHSTAPKEKFICRVCGRMLSTKGNLEVHEGTHIAVDSSDYIKCTVCSKAFKSRRFMVEHRKLVHDKSKVVACPNCSHVSTCKGSHNIHFKSVHLKLKDFICTECGLGFCTNSQLTRHFRIHSGERPYECTSCLKPFRLSTHRNRHEKTCPKRMKQ